jgi:hypothetical protein
VSRGRGCVCCDCQGGPSNQAASSLLSQRPKRGKVIPKRNTTMKRKRPKRGKVVPNRDTTMTTQHPTIATLKTTSRTILIQPLSHARHHKSRSATPPPERRAWLIALALRLVGAEVLPAILHGGILHGEVGFSPSAPTADPPAMLVAVANLPAASASEAAVLSRRGAAAGPYAAGAGTR